MIEIQGGEWFSVTLRARCVDRRGATKFCWFNPRFFGPPTFIWRKEAWAEKCLDTSRPWLHYDEAKDLRHVADKESRQGKLQSQNLDKTCAYLQCRFTSVRTVSLRCQIFEPLERRPLHRILHRIFTAVRVINVKCISMQNLIKMPCGFKSYEHFSLKDLDRSKWYSANPCQLFGYQDGWTIFK